MSDQQNQTTAPWPKTVDGFEGRARDLFVRAKEANDPDMRDVLSAAAAYYAGQAEWMRANPVKERT